MGRDRFLRCCCCRLGLLSTVLVRVAATGAVVGVPWQPDRFVVVVDNVIMAVIVL